VEFMLAVGKLIELGSAEESDAESAILVWQQCDSPFLVL